MVSGVVGWICFGVGAGMSESGFVKRDFFETYITEHFAKYAGIEK